MFTSQYLIALGSNQRHVRYGLPRPVLKAALSAISEHGIKVKATARAIDSRPVGPSNRLFANSAAIIETGLSPLETLAALKTIEHNFGTRIGRPWSRRVLDLDIILWSEGTFYSGCPSLIIPHPLMRERHFVLQPAKEIAGNWRDPVTGNTIHQLCNRLLSR